MFLNYVTDLNSLNKRCQVEEYMCVNIIWCRSYFLSLVLLVIWSAGAILIIISIWIDVYIEKYIFNLSFHILFVILWFVLFSEMYLFCNV